MGCQCAHQNEENDNEILKKKENLEEPENLENNNNDLEQKDEIFGLTNQEGNEPAQLKGALNEDNNNFEIHDNNENNDIGEEHEEEYNEQIIENKNTKYADYPEKMLELINKIRENPYYYADVVEDSIKNIVEVHEEDEDEAKPKIIYKKKVKVALAKGEPSFRECSEKLRNMESLPPLEFKNDICVPLPDNEEDIRNPSYLRDQVKVLRETSNIDVYFKDLIKIPEVAGLLMIVDDSEKSPGRKRNAVLNREFKYIGINSKFIGKTFVAYFTFSK